MEEIKLNISKNIEKVLKEKYNVDLNIEKYIEVPKNKENGDFSFPCFILAKDLRKSPNVIAEELKELLDIQGISKVSNLNAYINFFVDNKSVCNNIISDILNEKDTYGSLSIGEGKNVCIDYSSPNIAKPFHIGHFRNTVIGRCLDNLYKNMGYNVISINYLGDYGRQFGLLIEGYNRFKQEYNIEEKPIESLTDIYVRITKMAKEDESIFDLARKHFKDLEDGKEESYKLWKYFRDVSLTEYEKVYDMLNCKFTSYNGESFYNDKMDKVIDILNDKKVLVDSKGAKVVFLDEDKPPCIILKSDGSTIYATRDLAAIIYRSKTYNYEKSIYVTSYEQIDHFKQVFEVSKHLVDEKYTKGLIHVPYGMVRLKSGKMSTREGNVIHLNKLIDESILKAKNIILEKDNDVDVESLSKKIGLGALTFNNLKTNKIKDIIFDIDEALRFEGETGPYIQYMYVRIQSLLSKANVNIDELKYEYDFNLEEVNLIKLLNKFKNVLIESAENYEPSILCRYILDVASNYSSFYNNNKILSEKEDVKNARIIISYITGIVIKKGLEILGIESPNKM